MSVQTQIDRLTAAKSDFKTLLQQNGVAVADTATLDGYPALFAALLQSGAAYLYKAAFPVDGWSGSTTYTQTVTATPLDGAPALTESSQMLSPLLAEDDFTATTLATVCAALGVLNQCGKTFGAGSLTCTTKTNQKPGCDIEVFFLAR